MSRQDHAPAGADPSGYDAQLFPSDYASWRHCIEVKCGLRLTRDYVQARLAVLSDPGREETERFIRTYGRAYWLSMAVQTRASSVNSAVDRHPGR
ncbi:hypothetical protein [Thiohalocapsa halophila]|uniref:hypothetical protein n=1 Tax=Thiohalocapsa halophila TaxID=69359 RepID=UPI001F5B6C3D|nr:hypothetical protein [Thiohalocapsa halophila]